MEQQGLDKTNALREFAIRRSVNAAVQANENSRPMAQAALLINGAAASAIIAFLTKDRIDSTLFEAIPWALTAYAIGVVSAAVAMYFMSEALDYWNCYWELIARDAEKKEVEEQEKAALRSWVPVRIAFSLAIFCFLAGSGILACALWRMPLPAITPGGPG